MTNIADYYSEGNLMEIWQIALADALKNDHTLFFPKGCYDIYPEHCTQKLCYFSNNDESVKTIAFLLENIDRFILRGDNAKLMFHGRISPIVAMQCSNLHIEGISIDFEDSFVSDADLVCRKNGLVWFSLSGKHWVEENRLRFTDDFYDNLSGVLNFYPYDLQKNELFSDQKAISVPNHKIVASPTCGSSTGLVGLPDCFGKCKATSFVIKHENRLCPGIVIDECEHVKLQDVTIHHCAGMGVLCQNSSDVALNRVNVIPHGRRIAASDDAVHLVECRGKLSITDCNLACTLDDSVNVHGIYRPLRCRKPGGFFYYLDTAHFQQMGLRGARDGDTLELIKNDTHIPYHYAKIKSAKIINKAMTLVEFESPLPEEFTSGDRARVMEVAQAELTVSGCTLKTLLGRGVLASGLRSITIKECHFHTPGSGVFISGGVDFWHETGPVEYALIENNYFDNCNYRSITATQEAVAVFPELSKLPEGFFYHNEIIVRNNRFRSTKRPLVSMLSVKKAVCIGNEWIDDSTYCFIPPKIPGYYFSIPQDAFSGFKHCGEIITSKQGI